jgi:hypothetical protein
MNGINTMLNYFFSFMALREEELQFCIMTYKIMHLYGFELFHDRLSVKVEFLCRLFDQGQPTTYKNILLNLKMV